MSLMHCITAASSSIFPLFLVAPILSVSRYSSSAAFRSPITMEGAFGFTIANSLFCPEIHFRSLAESMALLFAEFNRCAAITCIFRWSPSFSLLSNTILITLPLRLSLSVLYGVILCGILDHSLLVIITIPPSLPVWLLRINFASIPLFLARVWILAELNRDAWPGSTPMSTSNFNFSIPSSAWFMFVSDAYSLRLKFSIASLMPVEIPFRFRLSPFHTPWLAKSSAASLNASPMAMPLFPSYISVSSFIPGPGCEASPILMPLYPHSLLVFLGSLTVMFSPFAGRLPSFPFWVRLFSFPVSAIEGRPLLS